MRLRYLTLLLAVCAAFITTYRSDAASRVWVTVTVTNNPETGDTLTCNSDIRTWTNVTASTTIATNASGGTNVSAPATNMFLAVAATPFSGPITLQWSATNAIRLIGAIDQTMTVLATGEWASVTYVTQSFTRSYTAIWPFDAMTAQTNRTNQASEFVYGLGTYSTNAFGATANALSNHLSKTAVQSAAAVTTWTGTNIFTGPTHSSNASIYGAPSIAGTISRLTNGLWTNAIIDGCVITNLRPAGAGDFSIVIGESAMADGDDSVAIGSAASANLDNGVAVGNLSGGNGYNMTAVGTGSHGSGGNSVAVGYAAQATATNSIAIGASASSTYSNSIAFGNSAQATVANQIVLGTSSHMLTVPGYINAATLTNTTLKGTNVIWEASYRSSTYTGMAEGEQTIIHLGTNTYWRMSDVGGTATNSITGLGPVYDGRMVLLQFPGTNTIIIKNESGGGGAAPANRITTGTGADVTLTNQPGLLQMIYDGTAARWRIISAR